MTEKETVEIDADVLPEGVDPHRLSDEVVLELSKDNDISYEEAKKFGDKVFADEVMEDNSERTGALEYLNNRAERAGEILRYTGAVLKNTGFSIVSGLNRFVRSRVDSLRNERTMVAVVEDVRVNSASESVVLSIKHGGFGTGRVSLDLNSTALSNLVDYKSVDNPMDLDGESVLVRPSSFDGMSRTVVIPHNISFSGKVRFRLFGSVGELREKTRIRSMFDMFGSFLDIFIYTGIVAFLSAVVGEVLFSSPSSIVTFIGAGLLIPIVLWAVGISFTVFYFVYWIIASAICYMADSDFIEVDAR